MKNINTLSLRANTYFNAPVYLEKDYILLCPETPVSDSLISRLKKWNYNGVYSAGEAQNAPHTGSNIQSQAQVVTSLDKNIQQQEQEKEFINFYQSLVEYTEEIINVFMKKNALDVEGITVKIKETIEKIKKDRDMLLRFITARYSKENYFVTHGVHTTLLSLAIGELVKLPHHRLIELGIAAFLHELGMFKIPNFLSLNKKADLSVDEKKALMAHTLLGYKLLKNYSLNENISLAALEHHEKWDGSGYPKRLKGETITLYARIIAVTCYFETQFAGYIQGKQMFNLPELIKASRTLFDEKVLKALILCLSFYPLGSCVLLSNGTRGIVYKVNPENPQCPTVRLTIDKGGNKVSGQVLVETSQGEGVSISRLLPLEE